MKKNKNQDRVTELETQLKRVAADFDNFRKRTEQEKRELAPLIQANTLLELAPVLDNFRRATEHLPKELEGNNWITGILYVEKQLEQIFNQFGIQKIKTVGEIFNPEFHEAISTEPDDSIPINHIIAELESGYTMNNTILKPAKVTVSAGKK